MAESAAQTQYRAEFVKGFEQRQSLLRDSVTTEAVIKGNTATFLIADSGAAVATTRGLNGLIQARADNLTQTSATLAEWHDLVRKTDFNIFISQGNQRAIMQQTTMAVVNRKIDADILAAMLTGTITWNSGTATTASLSTVMKAKTKLGNAGIPWDSNLYAVISPAFEGYLMQVKEFASREYVDGPPSKNADPAWRDKPIMYFWLGVNWIVHPNVSGVGTSTEYCFMYHKSALGHGIDKDNIQTPIGFNEEQGYSWARCSVHMGTALLQNTGVVEMTHDGSALS